MHIGGAKSGSTAVQDFLFANSEALNALGYAVPNTELKLAVGRTNQIWYFQNFLKNGVSIAPSAGQKLGAAVDAIWEAFIAGRTKHARGIILSAENLSNPFGFHEAFLGLKDRFRICVVLYIRRQEDFYQAAWQQWYVKKFSSIDSWLMQSDHPYCDWERAVDSWESIAPDEMIVRRFDRAQLIGGDIVDDFCNVLELDIASLRRPNIDMNVSFGVHVCDLYNAMVPIFVDAHDHSVEHHIYQLGVGSALKRSGEWIFTRAQIDLIRDRYAAGNARLKSKYFSHLTEPELFPPASETDTFGLPMHEVLHRNIGVVAELTIRQYRDHEAKIFELLKKIESQQNDITFLKETLVKLIQEKAKPAEKINKKVKKSWFLG